MAMNPTGLNTTRQSPILLAPRDGTATSSGGPGNVNFGNTQNPNPPASSNTWNPYNFYPASGPPTMNPPGAPGTPQTPGAPGTVTTTEGPPMTSPNPFGMSTDQANSLLKGLTRDFGTGMGTMMFQYLMSSGGYNSALAKQNVDATNAAMMKNIQVGEGNLQTNLAASGISPNSSSSALELSNYLSNAMTQMNQIDASIFYDMWNQSQNRELTALMDTGHERATATANEPTFMSQLTSILPLVSSGAAAGSQAISAANPNADTSFLDFLGGLSTTVPLAAA